MKFTSVNDVKIYNVSTGKTLPNWLSDRQKRRLLQNDSELRQRIQLLQDFDFPCAATRIKMSPNQQYIMATVWDQTTKEFFNRAARAAIAGMPKVESCVVLVEGTRDVPVGQAPPDTQETGEENASAAAAHDMLDAMALHVHMPITSPSDPTKEAGDGKRNGEVRDEDAHTQKKSKTEVTKSVTGKPMKGHVE